MPLLSTLSDNFNDNVIGPNWGNSYGGVSEVGGQARVPCTTSYAGYQTAYSWTLAGASFYMAIVTTPAASGATQAYASVFVNAPGIGETGGPLYGCRVGFIVNAVTGQLSCTSETGYYEETPTLLTYSAVTHKFLRLRETGGNILWDTSPDGTTWTNRRTLATPAWVTASVDQCALDLSAHRNAGTADYAAYDFFNTLSDGAVVTGAALLSADSSLTATGRVTVETAAALAAEPALTAAPTLTVHGDAALTADSDLTADATSEGIPEVAEMAAGDWDLRIEQGSTFVQTYRVTDAGFSWAGWNARAQIRSSTAPNSDLILDLTPYLTVDGPAVRLALPATVTQALTRNGRWDLEMYQGSTVVRILQGATVVSREVTR